MSITRGTVHVCNVLCNIIPHRQTTHGVAVVACAHPLPACSLLLLLFTVENRLESLVDQIVQVLHLFAKHARRSLGESEHERCECE
jgi:hypothetical protein